MVRLPRYAHPLPGSLRNWGGRPRRPARPPVSIYRQVLTGIPLTGGQAQGKVSGAGAATLKAGPQGLGTVWYPQAAVISTTTGAADNSTCQIYLGATNVANLLVGQSYAGGGDTVALAAPPLRPGELLIAVWSGGHSGDSATINIVGTMDALTA